jgi:hypothetical protein
MGLNKFFVRILILWLWFFIGVSYCAVSKDVTELIRKAVNTEDEGAQISSWAIKDSMTFAFHCRTSLRFNFVRPYAYF